MDIALELFSTLWISFVNYDGTKSSSHVRHQTFIRTGQIPNGVFRILIMKSTVTPKDFEIHHWPRIMLSTSIRQNNRNLQKLCLVDGKPMLSRKIFSDLCHILRLEIRQLKRGICDIPGINKMRNRSCISEELTHCLPNFMFIHKLSKRNRVNYSYKFRHVLSRRWAFDLKQTPVRSHCWLSSKIQIEIKIR